MPFSHEKLDLSRVVLIRTIREKTDRIVAMMTKIDGRGYAVREAELGYEKFSESESVSGIGS